MNFFITRKNKQDTLGPTGVNHFTDKKTTKWLLNGESGDADPKW